MHGLLPAASSSFSSILIILKNRSVHKTANLVNSEYCCQARFSVKKIIPGSVKSVQGLRLIHAIFYKTAYLPDCDIMY